MDAALAIVPTYLRSADELGVLLRCLETLRHTAPALRVYVVDDGSPAQHLLEPVAGMVAEWPELSLTAMPDNEGFSRTVNVGLRRAYDEGRDAVLVNADVEFLNKPGWLEAMLAVDAEVVGARLVYPDGLIQHAGIFFSLLHRAWGHWYQYAPYDLVEAQVGRECPVTGALQLIRHRALERVGFYDEDFRLGFEDVDYCLRVFADGGRCWYEPKALAIHHESLFRGRADEKITAWQDESLQHFLSKHAALDVARFVPEYV